VVQQVTKTKHYLSQKNRGGGRTGEEKREKGVRRANTTSKGRGGRWRGGEEFILVFGGRGKATRGKRIQHAQKKKGRLVRKRSLKWGRAEKKKNEIDDEAGGDFPTKRKGGHCGNRKQTVGQNDRKEKKKKKRKKQI